MKRFLICFGIAIAIADARADLVMQQQIITPDTNAVVTMNVKGSKIRLDENIGKPDAMSRILDLNTGEIIILMPVQKLYLKTMGRPLNQAQKSGATNAPIPHATGKTQKVGEYDTELYSWSNTQGITGTAWVAKSFPDYARIRADLAVLDKTAGPDNDASPNLSAMPGMVVRSQVTGGGQAITMTLISAKEGPLDNSLFGVPRGYKEVPKLQPLKTVGAQPAPRPSAGSSPTPKTPAPAAKSPTPPAQKLPAW